MAAMDEKQLAERRRKTEPIRDALRELRNRAVEARLTSEQGGSGSPYHEGREDAYEAAAEVLEEAIREANGGVLVGPGES